MRLDDGEKVPREVEIVGVVGDVRRFALEKEAPIEAYVPIGQVPDPTTIWLANDMYWVMRTGGAPLASATASVASSPPSIRRSHSRAQRRPMDGGALASRRFNLQVVGAFAAAALLLAVVGIYAVSAVAVAAGAGNWHSRRSGRVPVEVIRLVLRTGVSPVWGGWPSGRQSPFLRRRGRGMLFGVTPGNRVACHQRGGAGLAAVSRTWFRAACRQNRSGCRPSRGVKRPPKLG